MVRILVIGGALILGAILGWLVLPGMQPAASPGQASQESAQKPGQIQPERLTIDQRQARARKLLGADLQYVPKTGVYNAKWYSGLDAASLEQAMDECMVVVAASLYREHLKALQAKDETAAPTIIPSSPNPPADQVSSCGNLFDYYSTLVGVATWY